MTVEDVVVGLALLVILSIVLTLGCLIEKIADQYEQRDRARRTPRLVSTSPARWDDDLPHRLRQLDEWRRSVADDATRGGAA